MSAIACGGESDSCRASDAGTAAAGWTRAAARSKANMDPSLFTCAGPHPQARKCGFRLGERGLELQRVSIVGDRFFRLAPGFGDLAEAEVHARWTISHLEQRFELRPRNIELAGAHRDSGERGADLGVGAVRADRRIVLRD